jgi:hypothetical protein
LPTRIELWIYVPEVAKIDQTKFIDRMVGANPMMRRGQPPIGAKEGMLFTDVRFILGNALRSKNAQWFRPDLFEDWVEVDEGAIEQVAASQAFIRLAYLSKKPLDDRRHLRFMAHAAAAMGDLHGGLAVYDSEKRQLSTFHAYREKLEMDPISGSESAAFHVRAHHSEDNRTREYRSLGLHKIGHHDLLMMGFPVDEQLMVEHGMEAAIQAVWNDGSLPDELDFEYLGQKGRVIRGDTVDSFIRLGLRRIPE